VQVRGYTNEGLRKSILSCISVSSHLQIGVGVKLLDDEPENQAFFKKWTRWANDNHLYLRTKQDLFGQPCAVPLDGTAHMNEDRGYLFLFNESGRDRVGAVPLNKHIGLTRGETFELETIYPQKKMLYKNLRFSATAYLPVKAGRVAVLALRPANHDEGSAPALRWSNAKNARFEEHKLCIDQLQAWQGQKRSIIALVSGEVGQVVVNGRSVPFIQKDDLVMADLQFGQKPQLKKLLLDEVFNGDKSRTTEEGSLRVDNQREIISERSYGSGIYEMDVQCDFGLGGLQFKVDEQQQGGDAILLLDYFAPIDGNIGFWYHRPQGYRQFPIHWTLDGQMRKGETYRIRVQTFGSRHSITILDPQTGDKILGPFDYCFRSFPAAGKWGFRVREGSAIISRAAFAESNLINEFKSLAPPLHLISSAFHPRTQTRKMGQFAPEGTPMPVGAEKANVDFDYAAEQEKLWGGE
jgi:hypothetical protein